MIKRVIVTLLTSILILVMTGQTVKADISYISMEATAYCVGTTRCDGGPVHEGIAAAKKDWYGKVACVFVDDNGKPGEFIGIYEILDTGANCKIKEGEAIDIYIPSYDDCIQFGRQKVLVVLMEGAG